MACPGAKGAVDVNTVVEPAARVVPIWVPAPPEHVPDVHATGQRKIAKVGALPAGLEIDTVYDLADSAIEPELVTVIDWLAFAVNVIVVNEAVAPQVPEVTVEVPPAVAPKPVAPASTGNAATPSASTAPATAIDRAECRFQRTMPRRWGCDKLVTRTTTAQRHRHLRGHGARWDPAADVRRNLSSGSRASRHG
jgi:hypothetical protein